MFCSGADVAKEGGACITSTDKSPERLLIAGNYPDVNYYVANLLVSCRV